MWTILTVALLLQAPAPAPPPLSLDHLNRLTSDAHNVVDLTMDAGMLQAASALLAAGQGPDAAAARALVAGLESVRVRNFEFDRAGVYTDADIEAVETQLKAPWAKIISFNTREDHRRVDAYMWRIGDQPHGIVVVIAEPTKLVVVDVVGKIDLSQLGALKALGIPNVFGGVPGLGGK